MKEMRHFVVLHFEDATCKTSGVFMNRKAMDEMSIENDEIVLVKGQDQEETALKVHASDEIPKTSIGMNWLMQNNLDVQVGDSVSVRTRGNMYWWQIRKEPNKYIVPTAGKCSWRKIWFFDRGYYI